MKFKSLAIVILSAIMLTSCNASDKNKGNSLSANNPVTITLGSVEDTGLQTMIDEFNSTEGADKGIIVDLKTFDDDSSISSVDMVCSDYNTIYSTCSDQQVAELSDYFSSMYLGTNYISSAIETTSLSGLRAIPVKLDMNVLVVNKSAWEGFANAKGLDTSALATWDSMLSVAEQYYEYSNGEKLLSVSSVYDVAMENSYQISKPLTETSQSGAVINLTSELMLTVWDTVCVPQIKGYYTYGDYSNVQSGEVVMSYCPLSQVSNDDSIMVLQAPYKSGGYDNGRYVLDTTAIAVHSTDDTTIYASTVFIKWLTNQENNYRYALLDNSIPVCVDNLKESSIKSYLNDGTYSVNADGELLSVGLINEAKCFKVSPFDNVSTLEATIESRSNLVSQNETIKNRLNNGVLPAKVYEGILDGNSFKLWYDDISSQLQVAFNTLES